MNISFLLIIFLCLIFCWRPHLYYLWISRKTLVKKYLSIYCSEVLLQKYSQLLTLYIQCLGGWERGVNFNNHLLALLNTNIQEILLPLSSLFLKMCCICVLFTRLKFPVTDKIMCGSRKYPYLSPPPRIFHSRGSLMTSLSPLPIPPWNFQNFWTGTSFHPLKFKVVLVLQKQEVNTNSVMKYSKILLQQCKLLSSLLVS